MYIVGTSGHIDHGKTLLIRSLTGIDCDRLPEEKEREMTIDLGFAHIDYKEFGTVGVIDVPGHERFIRNMVAGAWGIDLGLLVVAVDDGWMPQTEDHFRVLHLLGVERIIAVLNKIDLVDADMIAMTRDEVMEKLRHTRYHDADIALVSAKKGEGIDGLKDLILKNLKELSASRDEGKPYLFVDRAFAAKGHGTVVTGTLKNGSLRDDDAVFIYPLKREARIKRIESHHKAVEEGSVSLRTALNISGVSAHEIGRGDIIYRRSFFTESDDMIARMEILGSEMIKNNQGIEVLVGTADIPGRVLIIDTEMKGGAVIFARIRLERPWLFYPGQPFIVTRTGGFRIAAGGTVILPRYERGLRSAVRENIGGLRDFSREEILAFLVAVHGRLNRDSLADILPYGTNEINAMLLSLEKKKRIEIIESFIICFGRKDGYLDAIRKAVEGSRGINLKEIADATFLEPEFCRMLIKSLIESRILIEKDGKYFRPESSSIDLLPDDMKKIVAEVKGKETQGIEMKGASNKKLGDLVSLGFLVSLDGNILWHREVYEDMKKKVTDLLDGKDRISIGDARDATGLSRKYLIPLLNRIERDGLIRRLGDFRVKA